jgi:hypothetical protein
MGVRWLSVSVGCAFGAPHRASQGLEVAFANTGSRVRAAPQAQKNPPLERRWVTDTGSMLPPVRDRSDGYPLIQRLAGTPALEVVRLDMNGCLARRRIHPSRRLTAHLGHARPVRGGRQAPRHCRVRRIGDARTTGPAARATHGRARAGAKLSALTADRNARSSVHRIPQVIARKEKVASPMFTRRLTRRNRGRAHLRSPSRSPSGRDSLQEI